ncbi:hypothetical protein TNCV_3910431 [Trichonephila clavipes]|nr:hypothetical protein TNCV_3910431 [Trichonephila clavipes]
MFVFSVVLSVINLFLWTTTTCHRTLAVSDSEGVQRLVWPARSPDLNPIENVGMLWEASCWSKLSSDKQEHPHPCTHRGIKLPQQLIMLCKVWYDVWNLHSTVDISRTDTFL